MLATHVKHHFSEDSELNCDSCCDDDGSSGGDDNGEDNDEDDDEQSAAWCDGGRR